MGIDSIHGSGIEDQGQSANSQLNLVDLLQPKFQQSSQQSSPLEFLRRPPEKIDPIESMRREAIERYGPPKSPKSEQEIKALLPDHQIKDVFQKLLDGFKTGHVDVQQLRESMSNYDRARRTGDNHNLPAVDPRQYEAQFHPIPWGLPGHEDNIYRKHEIRLTNPTDIRAQMATQEFRAAVERQYGIRITLHDGSVSIDKNGADVAVRADGTVRAIINGYPATVPEALKKATAASK